MDEKAYCHLFPITVNPLDDAAQSPHEHNSVQTIYV